MVRHDLAVGVVVWARGESAKEGVFVGVRLGDFVLKEKEEDTKGLVRDEFELRWLVGKGVNWFWRGFSSLPGFVFFR